MDSALIARLLKETDVILGPGRLLSAYGTTRIPYSLVSPIDSMSGVSRLREGTVVSERPLILTPESLRERFEGFGEESRRFSRWLAEAYRDLLRALEYRFKNQDLKARVLREDPRVVSERIRKELAGRSFNDRLLIRCPDAAWSLALMKFTLEEAARSFPSHLRSYEEHGLFDPASGALRRVRGEMERLFGRAAADPSAREALGVKLKEHGLFEEYEDRFLSLFRSSP